jgi:ribosomal protein S18 acetylase RimI-like enzyme
MSSDLIIRDAAPKDASGIATVQVLSWRAAYRGILPQEVLDKQSVDGRTERWHEILADLKSHTLVAERADNVVGFGSMGAARDEDTDPDTVGEVWALYALPDEWGQGVGRALWLAGEAHLRSRGYHSLILWVLEANERARRFYEGAGCALAPRKRAKVLKAGGKQLPQVRYQKVLTP